MIALILAFWSLQPVDFLEILPPYFEGQIVYELSYEPNKGFSYFNVKSLKERIGASYVLTYRRGAQKKEYFAPDGTLLSTRYLDLKTHTSYVKYANNDTIYWFDVRVPTTPTEFELLEDTVINQRPCKAVQYTFRIPTKNSFQITVWKHYYALDLAVNPKWFKGYYETRFNEVVQAAPYLLIAASDQFPYWKQHTKAVSITHKKIDPKVLQFKPPAGAPMRCL